MPRLVDPSTGKQYDYSDLSEQEIAEDRKSFGLITPEEYANRQKAEEEGALGAAGRALVKPIVGLTDLGMRAGILDEGTPEERAQWQANLQRFGEMGAAHEAVNPVSSFAGGAIGQGTLGAVAGGAGAAVAGGLGAAPLVGGAIGLATESATSGVSQEAIDAVTEKRDFSAKAAAMKGLVDLAFGAVGAGASHGMGRLLGDTAGAGARAEGRALGEVAGDVAEGAEAAVPPRRNLLAELDPGEVPAPLGGPRRARSAGAAGASNAPYRSASEAGTRAEQAAAGAANDVEPFADDLYDAAIKSIDEGNAGKGLDKEARFLADPKTAKELTNLGAANVADNLDQIRTVIRDDASLAAKNEDFARLAKEWTPEQIEAQARWVERDVVGEAEKILQHVDDTRAAAAGVRGGTPAPKPAPAATIDDLLETYGDDVAERAKAGVEVRQATRDRLVADGKAGAKPGSRDWRAAEAAEVEARIASRRPAPEVESPKGPRAGAAAFDAGGFDSSLQKTLRTDLDRVARATGAERVVALDSLKRNVGGLVRDLARSKSIDEATKAERIGLLEPFYEKLRVGLHEQATFGKLGALQEETNQAVTRLIEPLQRIEAKFSERLGDTWGKVGQQAINRETKASAVTSMLRASPTEQREFIRVLDDATTAADDLLAVRQRYGIKGQNDIAAARRGLQEIRDEFKFQRVLQAAERRAGEATPGIAQAATEAAVDFAASRVPVVGGLLGREGKKALRGLVNAPGMPAPGTALGDALSARLKAYSRNPDLADAGTSRLLPSWLQEALRSKGGQVAAVGGVVGAGALLAPGEAGAAEFLPEQKANRDAVDARLRGVPPEEAQLQLRTAESFARIGHEVNRRVEGAVQSLFSIAKDPRAPMPSRSPEARALDKRAAELDVPRHLARFMGKHDDPVAAWREKSRTVTAIVRDPARVARVMAESLGELPRHEPEIFASMVAQTVSTATYLYDTMPVTSGKSVLSPEGYPPTYEEIDEWAGHYVGALHALDTLDDLATNDLVPEQMQAVQALNPDAYQMFQVAAMKQIDALSRRKRPIPIEALEQIDSALDLDGAGEPTLSSAMADLLRKAEKAEEQRLAQEAQQAPPPPGPSQPTGPSRLASSALGSLHGGA